MDDAVEAIEDLDARMEALSPHKRMWALPLMRALEALGGAGKPAEVEARVRMLLPEEAISDGQWRWMTRTNRLRWSRLDLNKAGFVGGPRGTWELTADGRSYLAAHADDPLEPPTGLHDDDDEAAHLDPEVERVDVTDFAGYELPVLESLERGIQVKQDLIASVFERVGDCLLPGDLRLMKSGEAVWSFRTSWVLSMLKQAGHASNPSRGMWEITDSGRERLGLQRATWSVEPFQKSSASVVRGGLVPATVATTAKKAGWARLRDELSRGLVDALEACLRPDLAPTARLARNLILYGPPGTGKTHVAKMVAEALSESDEPKTEARWRIVQFHPSYAYEDFVEGIKPDLGKTELRYVLRQGPFMEIVRAAAAEPERFHVLVIDEINRGDPSRIFGELLYALEYRDERIDLCNGGQMIVPANLVVVGTMNSVDRSVALVDYALRRRFAFVRVAPDSDVIASERGDEACGQMAAHLLDGFNAWLTRQLGADHAIGHSYFLNRAVSLGTEAGIERVWQLDVQPLLEEYFFGEAERLKEARREWVCALDAARAAAAELGEGDEDGAERGA